MSTATTFTEAGSRFPVAIECNIVAIISAIVTPFTASRIRRCASAISMITSGSGPSSRTEPASTSSTLFLMHSYIIPSRRIPLSTAFRSEPAFRIALIACI